MIARLLITAVGILMLVVSTAYAGDGAIWHGLGEGAPLGGSFQGVMGLLGFTFSSGSHDLPSPSPDVSETPISETETILAAFYEQPFGNFAVGIGAAHMMRSQTGTKTVPVDGEPRQVPVEVLNDKSTSLAALMRVVLDSGPVFGDAQAILTSNGVVWSARVGWTVDRLRIGVGYQAGPTDDWWSGPQLFVGASW